MIYKNHIFWLLHTKSRAASRASSLWICDVRAREIFASPALKLRSTVSMYAPQATLKFSPFSLFLQVGCLACWGVNPRNERKTRWIVSTRTPWTLNDSGGGGWRGSLIPFNSIAVRWLRGACWQFYRRGFPITITSEEAIYKIYDQFRPVLNNYFGNATHWHGCRAKSYC